MLHGNCTLLNAMEVCTQGNSLDFLGVTNKRLCPLNSSELYDGI